MARGGGKTMSGTEWQESTDLAGKKISVKMATNPEKDVLLS